MRESITEAKNRVYDTVENSPPWLVVVCAMLLLFSAGVVAQDTIQGTWEDDFEDGTVDGWEGENFDISQDSVNGDYSLEAKDDVSNQEENPEWVEGPVLDLSESFTLDGTMFVDQGSGDLRVGLGLVQENEQGDAEGVLLLFSDEYDSTFIAEKNVENPNDENLETINGDFDGMWVNFELVSDSDGTVKAKVWEHGTEEPAEYQISRGMGAESGQLSVFVGTKLANRQVHLDNVVIEGQSVPSSPRLNMETRDLYKPGETHEYSVVYTKNESGRNITEDVTQDAEVQSLNSSLLTVDETNNTITAAENASASVGAVRATYNNSTTYKEIVVAEPTVKNLEILPGMWRITTVISDPTIFFLLIATFAGVAATRFSSSFAGIGIGQMVMTIGWFAGYVAWAIAAVSLFAAMFIGLNLALNTEFTGRVGR